MPLNINAFDFRLEYASAFRKFCKCAYREPDVCGTFICTGFLYKCRVRKIIFESGDSRKSPTHLVIERAKIDEEFRPELPLDECETREATDKIFKDGFFIPVTIAKKWKLHPFDHARTASSAPSAGVIFKPRAKSLFSRGSTTTHPVPAKECASDKRPREAAKAAEEPLKKRGRKKKIDAESVVVFSAPAEDHAVFEDCGFDFKIPDHIEVPSVLTLSKDLGSRAISDTNMRFFLTLLQCEYVKLCELEWEKLRKNACPTRLKIVEDEIDAAKRCIWQGVPAVQKRKFDQFYKLWMRFPFIRHVKNAKRLSVTFFIEKFNKFRDVLSISSSDLCAMIAR
ncbi:hypothetical protein CYMTET_2692 [Cymbomonas tetramitiformis]|uniref:Uncharacterized protein n=1 Tax=Cymbomonas tetramitiformis TaxID=36881 RepID=A0AAE0H4R8_9CHLO|nr:hypothetical protein CYMTET_2692 [Cymbomonas tetramitiformis]